MSQSMVGSLVKQLFRALPQYVSSQTRRAFGRGAASGSGREPPLYQPARDFDWKILSDDSGHIYEGGPSPAVLQLLVQEPRFILDVGCSGGDFALNVKQRFPGARLLGIEPNPEAARIAAAKMDQVLSQPIEDVDWARAGVKRGDIDTVFLMDVLEHTYDPWKTLLTLRNLVSADAQLVVSIPNVRNLLLMQDLVSGYWRYRRAGLLDITHIRFFTQKDMYRLFYQTGFRVVKASSTFCQPAGEIFARHREGPFPQTIALDSLTVTAHSLDDLASLCTLQHMVCLKPVEYEKLSADERQWIDAPHPPTVAYCP